jgi:hypothetical protein
VVTVFGRPGRDASQVVKPQGLNWAIQFLTEPYDGEYCINVCQNGVNFLQRIALQEKKKLDESSCLDVVEIKRVAYHAFFQHL